MILSDLIRKRDTRGFATATFATLATHQASSSKSSNSSSSNTPESEGQASATVARVAKVAVANPTVPDGSAAILSAARSDGLTLWPDGDLIRVRGPAHARAKWVEALKANKGDILILLWAEVLREHFEERAATFERDGGLPRPEAEEQARRSTALLARNIGAPWTALRRAVEDASLPDSPEPVTHTPYPLPTWATTPDGKTVIPQGDIRHAKP